MRTSGEVNVTVAGNATPHFSLFSEIVSINTQNRLKEGSVVALVFFSFFFGF